MDFSVIINGLTAAGFSLHYFREPQAFAATALLIIVISLLAVIASILTFLYNTRKDLEFEAIPDPPGRLRKQVDESDNEAEKVEAMGFRRFDRFFAKMMPETVTYIYEYNAYPAYLLIYHLGVKKAGEIVSVLDNNYTLTTSSSLDSGHIPFDPQGYLQIVEEGSYKELIKRHKEALDFLKKSGIKPVRLFAPGLHEQMKESIGRMRENVLKTNFWPALLVFWVIFQRGRKYTIPLQEQVEKGITKINREDLSTGQEERR